MRERERLLGVILLAYWPAWYVAFYLPWIVPRLPHWRVLPTWVYGFAVLFALGLAFLGALSSSRRAAAWATSIGGTTALLNLALTELEAPGFVKHHDADLPTVLLLFAIYILACLAVVGFGGTAGLVAQRVRATLSSGGSRRTRR